MMKSPPGDLRVPVHRSNFWRAALVLPATVVGCATPTPAPSPPPSAPTTLSTPTPHTDPVPTALSTPTPTARANPITARFVPLGNASYAFRACELLLVNVTRGTARVAGEELGVGDVLVMQGTGDVALKGEGTAVLATVQPPACDAGQVLAQKKVIRASAAPELTWAGGAMRAHLDVEKNVSPNAYMGRLSGTAPVAEHAHADSWEVICALEASGTFRVSGKDGRLGSGACVAVPPGEKHAWTPDPGTSLVAVQMYAPPGPEQRFRALAAGDAGAPPTK